jgi:hypothetical protein
MEKYKVHKNCSCQMCRKGKDKKTTKIVEKKFRRLSKQTLSKNPLDFENVCFPSGYYD